MRTSLYLTMPWLLGACAAREPPQGYRPATLNGQLPYCRAERVTGSEFSGSVCLSEHQFRDPEETTRRTPASRAMRPNLQYHNQECSY